jgi:hypothetical protein
MHLNVARDRFRSTGTNGRRAAGQRISSSRFRATDRAQHGATYPARARTHIPGPTPAAVPGFRSTPPLPDLAISAPAISTLFLHAHRRPARPHIPRAEKASRRRSPPAPTTTTSYAARLPSYSAWAPRGRDEHRHERRGGGHAALRRRGAAPPQGRPAPAPPRRRHQGAPPRA